MNSIMDEVDRLGREFVLAKVELDRTRSILERQPHGLRELSSVRQRLVDATDAIAAFSKRMAAIESDAAAPADKLEVARAALAQAEAAEAEAKAASVAATLYQLADHD